MYGPKREPNFGKIFNMAWNKVEVLIGKLYQYTKKQTQNNAEIIQE